MFDIASYLQAGYPTLWIRTWEEERALAQLAKVAGNLSLKLKIWSVTEGWLNKETGKRLEATDPVEALNAVRDGEDSSLYVFLNFHFYLGSPEVLQKMKDLIPIAKSRGRHLVFLSCRVDLPPEIEKEITLIDIPLPSIEELSAVLDTVLESVPHPIQVDDRKALLENALGLTCAEAENVFALSLVRHKSFSIESIRDVQQEKSNVIRKSGLLEFISAELTTEEIGGLDLLKSWLAERKRAFSEEAQAFGLPNPKGVLVVGVPGSGKSLSAKAISSAWNLPLLRFDIGKVFGSLVGQSEEQMRRALQLAETISPCILWIDELEKGMAGLQTSGTSDSGVTARVLGTFLTWMQEKTRPVFVFATANNVNALPPEMLRKGRFDELFYVDLPSEAERREILRIHLKKRRRNPETFDLVQLARECDGFGGAEIEQAIISGLYRAFSHKRDLQTGDILAAYRETKPLSQIMKAHIERIREWGAQHARPASSSMAESAGDDNKRRLVL
ncbi:MAG: hypothetical protein K0Q59_381 [Paenibacillus sp.]|nr:hypothetical protein [Paenibacillus sp.]